MYSTFAHIFFVYISQLAAIETQELTQDDLSTMKVSGEIKVKKSFMGYQLGMHIVLSPALLPFCLTPFETF